MTRFSVGRACPLLIEKPCDVLWNSVGVSAPPVDRIGRRIACVELLLLEGLAGHVRPADHPGEFACDVEVSAAVVAQVENEVGHVRGFQCVDAIDELTLGRRDVIGEQQIADSASAGLARGHGLFRHGRGRQRDGTRSASTVAQYERMRLAVRRRREARVERVDPGGGVVVDQIDAVDRLDLHASRMPAVAAGDTGSTYSMTSRRGGGC